jgi:Tat protein translocase TatB subunit
MELLVIFVVALLVLGPTKLPEAGRQIGRALAEFRRWSTGVQNELREALEAETTDRRPPVIEPLPEPHKGDGSSPRPPTAFPEEQSFT